MPTWEVRRVSGRGFLFDISVAAYKDLDRMGIEDMKLVHKPRAIGEMMEFVNVDHLIASGTANHSDLDALPTTWKGEPLPQGAVYCVVMEWKEGTEGKGPASAEAIKKAVQVKIEDKVVQAEGDKLFKAGGANAEARKNLAQSEKMEGGVWGSKRKGPPR